MPTLTQTTGLKIAPLFLQSFVKHYYGKVVKDPSSSRVSLRDEELLYDQVFFVVKVCIARVSSQRNNPHSRWCHSHSNSCKMRRRTYSATNHALLYRLTWT